MKFKNKISKKNTRYANTNKLNVYAQKTPFLIVSKSQNLLFTITSTKEEKIKSFIFTIFYKC